MVDFQFVFDDHDEFEDSKGLDYEDSECCKRYLLLSKSFSLLCFTLLRKIGILSG